MREEPVEFTTIREDFSEYEADNGQILKVKAVVTDIVNVTNNDGRASARLNFKTISHVITPIPIDTSNFILESNPDRVIEQDQIGELTFRPLKEITNIYETKQTMILLIPQMQRIFLTNKKDANGAPHLRFTMSTDVSILSKHHPPPPRQ